MLSKTVTKYICAFCKTESENKVDIENCEARCSCDVYPIVKLQKQIDEKTKQSKIKQVYLRWHDDNGKFAGFEIRFEDGETYQLSPFNEDCLDIY